MQPGLILGDCWQAQDPSHLRSEEHAYAEGQERLRRGKAAESLGQRRDGEGQQTGRDEDDVDQHGHSARRRAGTRCHLQPRLLIRSRQAVSQRRHASAQTRQCSCMEACRSHSSPQALHAAAQASRTARVRLAS